MQKSYSKMKKLIFFKFYKVDISNIIEKVYY